MFQASPAFGIAQHIKSMEIVHSLMDVLSVRLVSLTQLENKDLMASSDGFPASFYGEPGVLGMLSNGISAFLVLLQNFYTAHTGTAPAGVENILAG